MASTVLPLQDKISQASQMSKEYAVDEIKYGNGYSQRAKSGINNITEKWSLSWDAISASDFATLVTAFDTAAGVDTFLWTPIGSSTQKKFIVSQLSNMSPKSGSYYSVSVTLEQRYDL